MKNINLHAIKQTLQQTIRGLYNKDFRIWQDGDKIKLQCCIIHGNRNIEFYGHIYEVDMNKRILQPII